MDVLLMIVILIAIVIGTRAMGLETMNAPREENGPFMNIVDAMAKGIIPDPSIDNFLHMDNNQD